jgi:phthalate 4,5-cis-dihydrodiol dehydrogenase
MPDGTWVYGDREKAQRPLTAPPVPRFEVIDELFDAIVLGQAPLHDGAWARSTLAVCLALLASAGSDQDVELPARGN